MTNTILLENTHQQDPDFEFVERKGAGHPDTLADGLAERLSLVYSRYTKNKFGAILHHNFDKVGLLGGASFVEFGKGYLTQPIRILLTGRASTSFGNETIDVEDILTKEARRFMKEKFPMINAETDLKIYYMLSNKSSPGKIDEDARKQGTRKFRFEPRDLNDLKEIHFLGSNDTSLGCGYFPYSALELLVLQIENTLNSDAYKNNKKRLGSDIKIMGTRHMNDIDITLCIPQISTYVQSIQEYLQNLHAVRKDIENIIKNFHSPQVPISQFNISINTRDDIDSYELYLTAIGSSIESGDEGLVGRGNRINGVISPMKPMSMEGSAGKNPVYHIGKIYYIASQKLAEAIYQETGTYTEVYLVSQSGRYLLDPWKIVVYTDKHNINNPIVKDIISQEVKNIPQITEEFLAGKTLY